MKCRDMAEMATDFLEGALGPRARIAARFHLVLCDRCRRYMKQLRRTIGFLAEIPAPPPRGEDDILTRLAAERKDV